jgi:predicted HTH transcriptional regulator
MMLRMAEDLLVRVLREIRERKEAAQAAYEESRRLERALAALEPAGRRRRAPAPDPRRRSRARRSRAAPGANREAIVALVRERPAVTAREVAEATGIARSTVTTTLKRLLDAGEIERTSLPGGGTGYRAGAAAGQPVGSADAADQPPGSA